MDLEEPTTPASEPPQPAPAQLDPIDRAKIEATLAQMTALLEEGKRKMAEVDEFYRKNNFHEGFGARMLVGDEAPEWSRKLFGRLLLLSQNMKQDIAAMKKDLEEPKVAPRPVGAKAISSRYRI